MNIYITVGNQEFYSTLHTSRYNIVLKNEMSIFILMNSIMMKTKKTRKIVNFHNIKCLSEILMKGHTHNNL